MADAAGSTSVRRALVVLATGAEEMELAIVVDVLRRASIEVTVAGLDGDAPVRCSRGLVVVPDTPLRDAAGDFDAIVLPGGAEGARRLSESAELGARLRKQDAAGGLVAAICAAPTALMAHGIGRGRRMTAHPSVLGSLSAYAITSAGAVVVDGALVTSQGPGTSFAFALKLVEVLAGEDRASEVRAPMVLT